MCAQSESILNAIPTILFYNSYFDEPLEIFDSPEGHGEIFTSDLSLLDKADVVVFHIPSPAIHQCVAKAARPTLGPVVNGKFSQLSMHGR